MGGKKFKSEKGIVNYIHTSISQQRVQAFYLDLKYKDPNGGEYTESTRMYVADNDEVFVR